MENKKIKPYKRQEIVCFTKIKKILFVHLFSALKIKQYIFISIKFAISSKHTGEVANALWVK